MAIEYTTHDYAGGQVTLATRTENADAYSGQIRGKWRPDAHTLGAMQLLTSRDYFLDLGANIGAFCLPVAKATGASGLAVEALQSNLALLQAGIEANGLSDRMNWFFAAIVEKNGEVTIAGDSAYGTVGPSGHRVLAYSLDGLMDEIGWPAVNLVKMDIEGCEMRALEGAKRFFERYPDVIFVFEANGAHCHNNGYAPQDLVRFFEDRGNHVYLLRAGRAIRRRATDFQESGVSDYIASPFPLEQKLKGFQFADFDEATKIREAVRTLSVMKPGYGRFMVAEMHLAPAFIRNDKEVQKFAAAVQSR
jgi:FkbM family methyltransferase